MTDNQKPMIDPRLLLELAELVEEFGPLAATEIRLHIRRKRDLWRGIEKGDK